MPSVLSVPLASPDAGEGGLRGETRKVMEALMVRAHMAGYRQ